MRTTILDSLPSRRRSRTWLAAATLFVALVAPHPASAQVTERSIAFDSAGRIMTVSADLAARLGLAAPRWPVRGTFIEARLVTSDDSTAVLLVQRDALRTDRYTLTADELAGVRDAFAEAMRTRRGVAEDDGNGIVLEDAARAFARGQKVLAGFVYGPAVARMIGDARGASAAYAIIAGGSYFALDAFAEGRHVTRAQADLATDGGWRGATMALLALGAAQSEDAVVNGAAVLTGSVLGSVAGYRRGAHLTTAEAQAASGGSTFLGLVTTGVLAATGAFGEEATWRPALLPVMGAMAAGWAIGPAYPRRAGYGVTAGDVRLVGTAGLLGAAAAVSPFLGNENLDGRTAAGIVTAGYLLGAWVGDRRFARPLDHRSADVGRIYLGIAAGATVAGAVPTLLDTGNPAVTASAWTAGGIVGAAVMESRIRAARRRAARITAAVRSAGDSRVQFNAASAVLAAAGMKGKHAIVRISF